KVIAEQLGLAGRADMKNREPGAVFFGERYCLGRRPVARLSPAFQRVELYRPVLIVLLSIVLRLLPDRRHVLTARSNEGREAREKRLKGLGVVHEKVSRR